MNNEKKIKRLRNATMLANLMLMFATIVLRVVAFEPLRHTILCNGILLLLTIELVFDGILKNKNGMIKHGGLYLLWLSSLTMTNIMFLSL